MTHQRDVCFVVDGAVVLRDLHSFPTRRSSDLCAWSSIAGSCSGSLSASPAALMRRDRKSKRLNSSHQISSYALFCSKQKTNARDLLPQLTRAVVLHPVLPNRVAQADACSARRL